MSNKPKWSADGFARRVKMSESDLWLVVEGRNHDRVHYELLLKALPSTQNLSVAFHLAEEIELGGVSAGGKPHALALHDHLQKGMKLTTSNSFSSSTIVFMLDRDRDDFEGKLRKFGHIAYTYGNDVEADILLHADIWAAFRATYGVDTSISQKIESLIDDVPTKLLDIWESWQVLSLTALYCGVQGCAPFKSRSLVNPNGFDAPDEALINAVVARIQAAVGQDAYTAGRAVAVRHMSVNGVRLLKGDFIADYIGYLVKLHLSGETIQMPRATNIVSTALVALKYQGPWIDNYEDSFSRILDHCI
ncbi:MAG: hypothetical protein Q4G21_03985 [Dermabacter sp.]|nr:hypothetical protein [Dermabacter sp.]